MAPRQPPADRRVGDLAPTHLDLVTLVNNFRSELMTEVRGLGEKVDVVKDEMAEVREKVGRLEGLAEREPVAASTKSESWTQNPIIKLIIGIGGLIIAAVSIFGWASGVIHSLPPIHVQDQK